VALSAIRRARELGVNFFDTAQAYGFGASERLLGEALRGELTHARDQLVIATKGGLRMTATGLVRDASPGWLREGVDASLRALGVEQIDLYQVHWPDPTVPVAVTAEALRALVAEGKIGHVGVSNFDAAIVGARRSQHVEESLAAADVSLTGADLAGIDAIMAAAVQVTGPSPDSV
jgi:aryl-alcohol dehydrogenase-like predicted oxidoreductase